MQEVSTRFRASAVGVTTLLPQIIECGRETQAGSKVLGDARPGRALPAEDVECGLGRVGIAGTEAVTEVEGPVVYKIV